MSQQRSPFPQVDEVSSSELACALEAGEDTQILDVRAPQRLTAGYIDIGPPENFINVPGSQITSMDPAQAGLDPERPIVVVCGRGNDSLVVAGYLNLLGYRARSLAGGMQAWNQTLIPRELPAPAGFDRLVQFDRIAKGALSYLLISGSEAFAIDPPASFSPILQLAASASARIVGVADTHIHADYISGAGQLVAFSGAPYYLHPADNVFPYDGTPGRLEISPLFDGQELTVGTGRLRVLHTPGHTEGSVCLVAGDSAAFTGDFLFINSVGRPDLAGRTQEWTPLLFASLQRVLREWSDNLQIYPAHYGGAEERNADRSVGRSFGALKAGNTALGIAEPAAFSAWVESHLSEPPAAYRTIKGINVGLHAPSPAEAAELEGGRNECALK